MTEIYACATHGVLSDPAIDRIAASSLREVVLTDSIPLPERKRIPKITTLSVAPLIGEAIKRIHRGESVGALFSSEVSLTQEMLLWEDGTEGHDRHPRRRRRRPAMTTESPHQRPARGATPGRPMSLQLHRPDGEGGLEPRPVDRPPTGATQLRSPRWGRQLPGERLPALKNPEMNPTSRLACRCCSGPGSGS